MTQDWNENPCAKPWRCLTRLTFDYSSIFEQLTHAAGVELHNLWRNTGLRAKDSSADRRSTSTCGESKQSSGVLLDGSNSGRLEFRLELGTFMLQAALVQIVGSGFRGLRGLVKV